jgi:mono/diheme cytochrome c family protein
VRRFTSDPSALARVARIARITWIAWIACASGLATTACSTHDDAPSDGASAADDARPDSPPPAIDATVADVGDASLGAGDASPTRKLAIVTVRGTPLEGAPGEGIALAVVYANGDGTTAPVAPDQVVWTLPSTIVATDPLDAGASVIPETGALPTAFYVQNPYRDDRPGVLFILDPGTLATPWVTVRATVADAGDVTATVAILPARSGDPSVGQNLFQHALMCATCHGVTGGGSPPATDADGGPLLYDGGTGYLISGKLYPFPAPGLNAAPDSGNVASDPEWSAAMFAVAAQADLDNRGAALRKPMPYWLGGTSADGGILSAQDFADLFAWLKTQTK